MREFLHDYSMSLSLANSYLVQMSNRSRYQDTMFDTFIIESETEEKEGKKEGGGRGEKREGKNTWSRKNFQLMTILIYERCND